MSADFQESMPFTKGNSIVISDLLRRIFLLMGIGVGVTAIVAWYFSSNSALFSILYTEQGMTIPGMVVMFAPLLFVLAMSLGYQRLSVGALALLFGAYSMLNGVSFSFIFMAYTTASIFKTFAIAASMFLIMAVLGYTTKVDLSRFGAILTMALIGIIIASLVNFFLKSEALDYLVSVIGVVVFTGLTAWDVQKFKRMGEHINDRGEAYLKLSIMGALTLYLDFINLFLFLLRFFGNRK